MSPLPSGEIHMRAIPRRFVDKVACNILMPRIGELSRIILDKGL
jgi:hypothetical protein